MRQPVRLNVLMSLLGIGILGALLVGCGQTVGSAGSPRLIAVSPSATPGASPSATLAPSSQHADGQVTLTLDKQRYAPGGTITVTIHNGLAKAVWSADHKTGCTVLTAEHLRNGQWETAGACKLETPTRMVALSSVSATVDHLSTTGWPSGTYRISLSYNGGGEGSGGPSGVAYSTEFTVG